jgi:hypothetical protein
MRSPLLACVLTLSSTVVLTAPAAAQQLLFRDNFDTADNASFDASPVAGRLSGTAGGSEAVLRSWGAQQQISNNQLLLPVGTGDNGVRFEKAAGPFGATNRYDWASGSAGPSILAAGGFSVSFDWIPADNTTGTWVSFQVGTINGDSANLTDDDYGILVRQNGNTERWDNSVNLGAGGATTASPGGVARKINIDYFFNSFADGSTVTAVSSVDGTQVASDSFTWDSNGGTMYMELGHDGAGDRVDNLSVSTVPEPATAALLGLAALAFTGRRRS